MESKKIQCIHIIDALIIVPFKIVQTKLRKKVIIKNLISSVNQLWKVNINKID